MARTNLQIAIPEMPWTQIGGDMDPGASGGTIAMGDGRTLELIEIQPVRALVGDEEAAEVGFPFWTRTAYFDVDDLGLDKKGVQSALQYVGLSGGEEFEEFTPEQRAIAIAEALLAYGSGDEGPAGWSSDIGIPDGVKWWGGVGGAEYLADEDESFRDDVLGHSEIKTALEEEADRMIAENAARGWSHGGDQLASDLAAEGFDPETLVIEADFGDAIVVNEAALVGATWARVLGVDADDLWSKAETRKLDDWLDANGYEYIDKAGGRVPAAEGYAAAASVIAAVAEKLDVPVETVAEVAERLDWWGEEIVGSASGYTYVWAKRF